MTSLGSLEQRRPDLVMISPGKTAAAVAAAADAISSERWQAGAELEVYSKKTETWRSGEIRSLPDEDMVEVVYTIDVPEPDTPRLKLCLRSSERLRWPKEEELLTITVRHDRLANDVSHWGLRFHADGVRCSRHGELLHQPLRDAEQGPLDHSHRPGPQVQACQLGG